MIISHFARDGSEQGYMQKGSFRKDGVRRVSFVLSMNRKNRNIAIH